MRKAWLSSRIVLPDGIVAGAVITEDERIAGVCAAPDVPTDAERFDFGDAAILPGLVDSHVHINEPGRTKWEGFRTATRAAAAGGYTTLIDMPLNCLPETTTVSALEEKRRAANGKCLVDWMSWGGVVDGNREHLRPLWHAGVPGYKCFLVYPGCDGLSSIDAVNLEAAAPLLAEIGLPLLVHAELQGPIDQAIKTLPAADDPAWRRYRTYMLSRPDESELQAIAMLLDLCRRYRFRLHIVHLATARALHMLASAKAEGLPVSIETCPHYLHLSAEQIADGATQFKCAPPIRTASNREGLWEGLRRGTIDLIATDHSPCPPEMKNFDDGLFNSAWGGIASLSTALPVMWTEARGRGFGLNDLARWMSAGPATLAGLSDRVGGIVPGLDANFAVFDTEQTTTVCEEMLYYRHKISPYLGEKLRGSVRATVLRGRVVFNNGRFANESRGREYRIQHA